MKRLLGIFIVVFFLLSPFFGSLLFAGDLGNLRGRLNGEVTEEGVSLQSVAGKTFFAYLRNSCGEIASSCMSFDREGTITWDQDFDTGDPIPVFTGRFREFRQGPNTFWGAVLQDDSPDGVLTLAGVASANSTFTFLANIDQPCTDEGPPTTAIGIYRRDDCTPGLRSGDLSDAGIAGGIAGIP